jgi:hypothetical protein
MWAIGATRPRAGAKRFIHDLADRQRAAPALSAATEAAIDLTGCARRTLRIAARLADIVIGKDVTGTNNHGRICTLES